MPRFSVFTPTHNSRWLLPAYESLVAQTETDWEWILVPNNGCKLPKLSDPRVKVFPYEHENIGALKRYACDRASGEWVVELDHDDELLPTCLEEIGKCSADFVYSNEVRLNEDNCSVTFSETLGWVIRPFRLDGREQYELVQPPFSPSNFSRIWFAPDHVRAWRREFYQRIGGHDAEMHVGDDHDLVCRSALQGTVKHIDKPLYVYNLHEENSWVKNQEEIDKMQWENHDLYFMPMAEMWADREGLPKFDLGGALDAPPNYTTVDKRDADIVCDLNADWPMEEQSVGILRAHDIMEHLHDPVHAMNEAHRVLVHGGIFDIMVPSTDRGGTGAFSDPTHRSFWNLRSFSYYTEAGMRRYLEPECKCAFQVVQLRDATLWDDVPYVQAQLLALHDGPRFHGEIRI